jgi:dephospho-CoA kinase
MSVAPYPVRVGSAEPLVAVAKNGLQKPMVIGITGGMASGKSTLARMFSGRGIMHVDADRLVHHLMEHDHETKGAIAAAFPMAMSADRINRTLLAAHIAKHPQTLADLEAIVHPRVRALEEKAILKATRNRVPAVILDVPLLFETAADELCDIVIVAHAPIAHRRRRAFARPGMNEAKWQRLIARQWPEADKKHLADIVIETSMGKAAMRRTVHTLMKEWGLR